MGFFNFGWLAGYRRGGRTPMLFPMTLGLPTVKAGSKLYTGTLYTRVRGGERQRVRVTDGKPQYNIIKFIPGPTSGEGSELYVMAEGGAEKTLDDMFYISGSTSWRDTINV